MLRFDLDSIHVSESGNLTAPIYFVFDSAVFPESGWIDFPAVVLSWWLEELTRGKYQDELSLEFMDGPFYLLLSGRGNDVLVTGIKRSRSGETTEFSQMVDFRELKTSIIAAAKLLLSNDFHEQPMMDDLKRLLSSLEIAEGS